MNEQFPNLPNRISFEDKEPEEPTKTVKLDAKKSRFAAKTEKKVGFEEAAKRTHDKLQGYQSQALELGRSFIKMINDKKLKCNKGPLENSFERETINKLISFAIDVNNDEHEREGMGSVGLITLMMNSILKMRDHINDLEHELSLIEKKLSSEADKENAEE